MRNRKFQLVACAMVALVGIAKYIGHVDAASNDPWAGKFRNETISLELTSASDGNYSGTIHLGEKQFSLKAHADDNQLQGTFQSEGTDFAFTASVNGDQLTLLTGDATFALKRSTAATQTSPTAPPPANPLAQAPQPAAAEPEKKLEPASPAESKPAKGVPAVVPAKPREKIAATETPAKSEPPLQAKKAESAPKPNKPVARAAGSNGNPAGTIILTKKEIFDPMIGCNAATILMPKGWKMEGGVRWRQHPFYPAYAQWKFFDPTSDAATSVYPMLLFNDGVREASMQTAQIAGPEAVQHMANAFPEGSNYMGAEVRRRVHTPADYVAQFIIPRFRPDLSGAKRISVQDMPGYAKAKMVEYGYDQIPNSEMKASRIRYAYQTGGHTVEEDFVCVLGATPMLNMVSWGGECSSYRAAQGKLDQTMPIFRTMDRSLKVDVKWFNAQAQVARMIQENIRQAGRQAVELSRYISQVNNEISDIITKSYESRQRTMDRVHENFDNMIRGVEKYESPFHSYPVEAPNDYDRVFTNPLGEIIFSNDVSFDPGTVSNQDWRELRKAD